MDPSKQLSIEKLQKDVADLRKIGPDAYETNLLNHLKERGSQLAHGIVNGQKITVPKLYSETEIDQSLQTNKELLTSIEQSQRTRYYMDEVTKRNEEKLRRMRDNLEKVKHIHEIAKTKREVF